MAQATLITGGTGLVGARLAEKIVAQGKTVVLYDLSPARWRVEDLLRVAADRVHIVQGDIVSQHSVVGAIKKYDIGSIVHLAATLGAESSANPDLATRVNVVGTATVLESARVTEVRRVLIASSIAVYGSDSAYGPNELPLRECATRYVSDGLPVYGASKLYCEYLGGHYADAYKMTVGGLRLSTVYGSGRQRGSAIFVSALVDRAIRGEPVTVGLGDAQVNVVYVDDVAAQFAALLEADSECFRPHRFFNTGGDSCTVREFADTVRDLIPDARITVEDSVEKTLAGMPASVSDALLVRTVGVRRQYSPLRTGLAAFIDASR